MHIASALASVLISVLITGCVQTRITLPKRTAVEELLISTAADQALLSTRVDVVRDRKLYVEPAYLESTDSKYVLGAIRDWLSQNGALLVANADQADIIAEPRSGGLSIDNSESLVGIPTLALPIPFAGTFESPELSLFKSEKQFSTAKIALLVFEKASGKHLHSTGPLVGKAYHHYYRLLGYIRLTTTSIPEKKRKAARQNEP